MGNRTTHCQCECGKKFNNKRGLQKHRAEKLHYPRKTLQQSRWTKPNGDTNVVSVKT